VDLKVFRQLKLTGLLDFAVARFYRTENDVISPPGAGNRHVFDLWATTKDHVHIVLNIFLGGNAVMLCHSCYVCVSSPPVVAAKTPPTTKYIILRLLLLLHYFTKCDR